MSMERERYRERETVYDRELAEQQRMKQNILKGRVVIRGKEVPPEQNRQGFIQFYSVTGNWDTLAAPGWLSFVHEIRHHSGKHRHQGGTALFVLQGKGYTVVNERRFDWEAGDLILLPVQAGGCDHQHFNNGDTPVARWVSLIYQWAKLPMANEVVQREVAPAWKQAQPKADEGISQLDALDDARLQVHQAQQRGGVQAAGGGHRALLDALLERRDRERQRLLSARMVVKGSQIEPELNRMGIFYWYTHPDMQDIGSRTTIVYVHEIPPRSRSGVQLHQGGRLHYVWQGRGHTVIDGVRHDWEAGDEILLPLKFDGVVHQHFNDSPDEPAKLVCADGNLYDMLGVDLGSGLEIVEPCPEYGG